MPDREDSIPQPPPDPLSLHSPLQPFWTNPRLRLVRWFERIAPSLAELYRSAVIHLEIPEMPGRSRIIGHCAREIANSLPEILADVERARLDYDKYVEELGDLLIALSGGPVSEGAESLPDPREATTRKVIERVRALVDEHYSIDAKQLSIARSIFQAGQKETYGEAANPVYQQWNEVREWFVGHAHDGKKTDSQYDWGEFSEKFRLFEEILTVIGQGFFLTLDDLVEFVRSATPDQIDNVIPRLAHPVHRRYFFDNLQDPNWIEAFKAKGFFARPPSAEGNFLQHWPVSEYLARVAGAAADPAAFTNLLLDIANALGGQHPPNAFVIRDIVEACIKLPGAEAIRLVPRFIGWVRNPHGFYFWRRLGRLAARLVMEGETEGAINLLSTLLKVERKKRRSSDEPWPPYRPVTSRIYLSDFRQIIDESLPALIQRAGRAALEMLCTLLGTAAKISHRAGTVEWDDNSALWHAAIGEEEEDDHDDVRMVLASAARKVAEEVVRQDPSLLTDVVTELENHRWLSLRRIALYILSKAEIAPMDLVSTHLNNQAAFYDRRIRTEYDLLAQSHFDRLSEQDQQTILGWVEPGPSGLEARVVRWRETQETEPSPEEIARYQRHWQWERLAGFHTKLPVDWQERYAALAAEFGEPQPRHVRVEARLVGPAERSPQSADELRTLTPEALRDFLRTWEPPTEGYPRPNRSSLAEVLTSIVTDAPERYTTNIALWQDLDPTYLHGIIRGFARALESEKRFPWEPVLDLCMWVLTQPREIPGRNVDRWEADPDWGGTRWWIVELLRHGFHRDDNLAIPIALRENAWQLLEALTMDPDPEPTEDEEDSERPGQSMHRAINSVRGRAIEGLVFYPGWIKRQTGDTGPASLPAEARAVLDRHLDLEVDPSLAIRSLYGRWFPWFFVFDREWGYAAVPRIFSQDERYWLVAWDGYICFNEAYEEVFEPFQIVYEKAVAQLRTPSPDSDDTRHLRDERLAGHLMTFYWRGHYSLEEQSSLLRQFFAHAPDKIRSEAIVFVGRSLQNTPEPVEHEVIERLHRLWEWRLQQANQDPGTHQAELKAFAWCFGSGRFDRTWAIKNLLATVRLTHSADPDFLVMENLPNYAAEFPMDVLECTRLLIEGQTSPIELSSWSPDLRTILTETRCHLRQEVRQASDEVVEQLGRLGYLEFKDLLSDSSG